MKLLENILLALCVVSLAIGMHQLYYYDVQEVYWILSLCVLLFLVYTWIKSKNTEKETAEKNTAKKSTAKEKITKQYIDKENSNSMPPKRKRKKRN